MTGDLTRSLAEHEAIIERGLNTFVEVGTALLAIREERLYRAEHSTFEDYCRERWGMSERRARQLMSSAEVVGTIVPTGLPAPANEGQARELARVPEERRAEVWRETVERTNGRPTAAAVRETYAPPPAVEPEPTRPPISDEEIAELRSLEDRPTADTTPAEPDEAELYASLDEAMESTDARFRLNFGRAIKSLFTVLSFDRDRVVETADHKTLQRELDLLTEWADDLRGRMRPGLRVVSGDRE